MSHVVLDEQMLEHYKKSLAKLFPNVRPSHRLEAMASGLGSQHYASLTNSRKETGGALSAPGFDLAAFSTRLTKLAGSEIEISSSDLEELFSYRTFVEVKNGYSREVVYGLSSGMRLDDFTCKLYVETLCAQPLLEDGSTILSAETVARILDLAPKATPDLDGLSYLPRTALELAPFNRNPGAASVMFRINEWIVALEFGDYSMSAAIVERVEVGRPGTLAFRVSHQGLQILRTAQNVHKEMGYPPLGRNKPL